MFRVLFGLLGVTSALSLPFERLGGTQTVFDSQLPNSEPADLPVSNPTHSFWINSPGANPLAGEGSTGDLTDEADVCIIGSGITGCRPRRNGGNLTPYEFLGFRKVQAMFGSEQAIRYYNLEHYTATEMDKIARTQGWVETVDLVEGGHMDVMLTDARVKEVRADFDAAVAAGKQVNVTWLSKEEMKSEYGTFNAGVRSPGYNVWPLKWVTQLFKLAHRTTPALDLRLHTRTPVTAVTTSSLRRWTLTTPRGAVHCSYVTHATNAYASHLLPHMHGTAGIVPVRGQVIALRADAALADLTRVSWVGGGGYWFPRPVAAESEQPLIILGGTRDVAGAPFEEGLTDDATMNPAVGRALRAFLPALFPGLFPKGREPEREWTGIMGYTALDIPFVGPVINPAVEEGYYKGQYVSAGYAGHGMPRAFACAEVVISMIAADMADKPWTAPEWFPSPFLTWVRDAQAPL
ncbi:FAD dependent oxidoreductase-domain-containing protein [Mycena sp. CBHHK59/15]|nr:FAD dependent oxidoreductase-domain-containing protein [Mycena sp. CBHHK59/15]